MNSTENIFLNPDGTRNFGLEEPNFQPIPTGLPPLPQIDTATHWWAYRRLPVKGKIKCAVMLPRALSWSVYTNNGISNFDDIQHVIELLPIDHQDPSYRAYMEDAFANGVELEMRNNSSNNNNWRNKDYCTPLNWDLCEYRIRAAQPAPPDVETEVDYFSEEYQVELFKRWKSGEEILLQTWLKTLEVWSDGCLRRNWEVKCFYREVPKPKPPEQVERPLEAKDIPPVCWIGHGSESGSLVTVVGLERVQFIGAQGHRDWSYQHLMDAGFKYSADRINWKPCSKLSRAEEAK